MVVGFFANFIIGVLAYLFLRQRHEAAADRRGDGGRLLRLRLGRHVRDLPRRADVGRQHRLRGLHAGDAGRHGDPRLPGGAVPGLAAAANKAWIRWATCRTSRATTRSRRRPRRHGDHGDASTAAKRTVPERARRVARRTTAASRQVGLQPRSCCTRCSSIPGLFLLFGGILIGFISRLQGTKVTHDADDPFFVELFQGMLCLFLLEMGMTASQRLRD